MPKVPKDAYRCKAMRFAFLNNGSNSTGRGKQCDGWMMPFTHKVFGKMFRCSGCGREVLAGVR